MSRSGIADAILARRAPGEEPIAICLGKDATAVASLLGVLKAGKIYVVLDAAYGVSRLAAIVADTGAPLILTDGAIATWPRRWLGPVRRS